MPRKSILKWIAEWTELVAAVDRHEAEIPQLGLFKAALAETLEEIQSRKLQRSTLESQRLHATVELHDALGVACELATRLRSLVKGILGPGDERLSEFGLRPARRRSRKPLALREEMAPPATTKRQ